MTTNTGRPDYAALIPEHARDYENAECIVTYPEGDNGIMWVCLICGDWRIEQPDRETALERVDSHIMQWCPQSTRTASERAVQLLRAAL